MPGLSRGAIERTSHQEMEPNTNSEMDEVELGEVPEPKQIRKALQDRQQPVQDVIATLKESGLIQAPRPIQPPASRGPLTRIFSENFNTSAMSSSTKTPRSYSAAARKILVIQLPPWTLLVTLHRLENVYFKASVPSGPVWPKRFLVMREALKTIGISEAADISTVSMTPSYASTRSKVFRRGRPGPPEGDWGGDRSARDILKEKGVIGGEPKSMLTSILNCVNGNAVCQVIFLVQRIVSKEAKERNLIRHRLRDSPRDVHKPSSMRTQEEKNRQQRAFQFRPRSMPGEITAQTTALGVKPLED
ncbi:hypothetical protein BC829DRAFT_418876 [Chytridium lagenaria]|nr:hypothetical protein BC829DRAFT_418876 [Chytridium lagenaria]